MEPWRAVPASACYSACFSERLAHPRPPRPPRPSSSGRGAVLAPGKNGRVQKREVSSGDATRVAETLPPCRLKSPIRASALLPPQPTSHTTPLLLLQVTLTTEPAAGFVYLAASRCGCRYALTFPLTAYPEPVHWFHISDEIFTIICILCLSQAP